MEKTREIVGYTTGVFDLFHIGHLNLLRNAKSLCDKLIVGVSSDKLVGYKNKTAVIPFNERMEIVRSIRYVDAVVGQYDLDKFTAWKKLKFDIMFVGDDWYNTEKWQEVEGQLAEEGVKVVFFPYTKGVSSTLLNDILKRTRDDLRRIQGIPKELVEAIVAETKQDAKVFPLVSQFIEHVFGQGIEKPW